MSTYSDLILGESGLVSYWRLGEASGALNDSKGTNHLTAVNSPTYNVASLLTSDPSNGAMDFERGSVQYLSVADNASLDLGDVVSIEAWIKPESTGIFQGILSKGGNAYYMRLTSTNELALLKSQVAGIVVSTVTLSAGSIYHVVATKNGATVKLYINGVDRTGTVSNATLANNAANLDIGGDTGFSTERFDGVIDDVALYSVALTSTQVLDHYNAGVAAPALVITPTTASLALSTFAPTVRTPVLVTPTTASLTTTRFAPTVLTPRLVTPAPASLTLSAFAPTVTANAGLTLTPPTAPLTLTAFAPLVTTTAHQVVTPSTASLTLSTFAPTVVTPVVVTPLTAALILTTFAPSLSKPFVSTITLGAGSRVSTVTPGQGSREGTVTPGQGSREGTVTLGQVRRT